MVKRKTLFISLSIITLFIGNLGFSSENDLKITINQEGSGERAEIGMSVSVHYTGKLEDGTVFMILEHMNAAIREPWECGCPSV